MCQHCSDRNTGRHSGSRTPCVVRFVGLTDYNAAVSPGSCITFFACDYDSASGYGCGAFFTFPETGLYRNHEAF